MPLSSADFAAIWLTLKLASLTTVAPMVDLPRLADEIVAGQIRGRTVIEIG